MIDGGNQGGIGGKVGGYSEVGTTGSLRQDGAAGGVSQPDHIEGGGGLGSVKSFVYVWSAA